MSTSTLVTVGIVVSFAVGAVNWGDMQWFHLLLRSGLAAAGSVLALVASQKAIVTFVEASRSDWNPEDESSATSPPSDTTGSSTPADQPSADRPESEANAPQSADDSELDAQQIADVISQQMSD